MTFPPSVTTPSPGNYCFLCATDGSSRTTLSDFAWIWVRRSLDLSSSCDLGDQLGPIQLCTPCDNQITRHHALLKDLERLAKELGNVREEIEIKLGQANKPRRGRAGHKAQELEELRRKIFLELNSRRISDFWKSRWSQSEQGEGFPKQEAEASDCGDHNCSDPVTNISLPNQDENQTLEAVPPFDDCDVDVKYENVTCASNSDSHLEESILPNLAWTGNETVHNQVDKVSCPCPDSGSAQENNSSSQRSGDQIIQIGFPVQIKSVVEQPLPTSNSGPSRPQFKKDLVVQCHHCGICSEDLHRCTRCRKELPRTAFLIPDPRKSPAPLHPGATKRRKTYGGPQSPQLVGRVLQINLGGAGPSSKRASLSSPTPKILERHGPTMTSSAANQGQGPGHQIQSQSFGQLLHGPPNPPQLPSLTRLTLPSASPEQVMHRIENEMDVMNNAESTSQFTTFFCRSIRVGSYCQWAPPNLQTTISDLGIMFDMPHCVTKKMTRCTIPSAHILAITAHFQARLPIIIMSTMPRYSRWLRSALGLSSDPKADNCYTSSPLAGAPDQGRILFIPDKLMPLDVAVIRRIYGRNMIEIDSTKANEYLMQRIPAADKAIVGAAQKKGPAKSTNKSGQLGAAI